MSEPDQYDREDVAVLLKVIVALLPVLLKVIVALLPVIERLTYLLPPSPETDQFRAAVEEAKKELAD